MENRDAICLLAAVSGTDDKEMLANVAKGWTINLLLWLVQQGTSDRIVRAIKNLNAPGQNSCKN